MIRKFTPEEEDFAKELISCRDNDDKDGLQAIRLIRNRLGVLAIRYRKNLITLYAPAQTFTTIDIGEGIEFLGKKYTGCIGATKNKVDKTWMYKLADILSTLQELEENRYIAVSRFENPDRSLHKEFFNRNEYEKLIDEGVVDGKRKLPKLKLKGKDEYIKLLSQEFNGDIAELFNRYGTGMIFPLESLRELIKNDFRTIEQRNFDDQMCWTRLSVFIAAAAAAIAAIMPFCAPPTKVYSDQVTTIDSAIRSIKTEYPTKIEVALPDTLTIKDIETRKTINNIHIHNGKDENGVNGYDSAQHR